MSTTDVRYLTLAPGEAMNLTNAAMVTLSTAPEMQLTHQMLQTVLTEIRSLNRSQELSIEHVEDYSRRALKQSDNALVEAKRAHNNLDRHGHYLTQLLSDVKNIPARDRMIEDVKSAVIQEFRDSEKRQDEERNKLEKRMEVRMDKMEKRMEARMDKQLNEFRAATAKIEFLQGNYNDLDNKVDDLIDNVKGLTVRVDGLENRMDKLENRMDGLEKRMEGVETRLDGVETRLGKLETKVDNLSAKVDSIDEKLNGMNASLQMLIGLSMKNAETSSPLFSPAGPSSGDEGRGGASGTVKKKRSFFGRSASPKKPLSPA